GAEAAWKSRYYRDRRPEILPFCDARSGQSGPPGDRPISQQPGREFALALPATRTSHAPVSANENASEVRLGPRLAAQPFQFGTPPRRSPDLQETPLSRIGRVVVAYGLTNAGEGESPAKWKQVAVTDSTLAFVRMRRCRKPRPQPRQRPARDVEFFS